MLKNRFKYGLIIIILITIIGCEDILEEDIADDFIQVIHPVSNDTVLGNSVNFTWHEISGADKYRIKVQDERGIYYLDSLVTGYNFITPFEPGSYYWSLRAENSAYQTEYSEPIYFTVISSDDLRYSKVFLESPVNSFYSNQSDIIFNWKSHEFAETYRFQLKNFDSQQIVVDELGIEENSYSLKDFVEDDGKYVWKVQALNDFSNTPFSERILYLDRQPPQNPILNKPDDQFQTIFKNVDFSWNKVTEGGQHSDITYGLEVSQDNLFSNITLSQTVQDTLFNHTFDNDGTYYWRVKAIDKAGNSSTYSVTRSIIIQ